MRYIDRREETCLDTSATRLARRRLTPMRPCQQRDSEITNAVSCSGTIFKRGKLGPLGRHRRPTFSATDNRRRVDKTLCFSGATIGGVGGSGENVSYLGPLFESRSEKFQITNLSGAKVTRRGTMLASTYGRIDIFRLLFQKGKGNGLSILVFF